MSPTQCAAPPSPQDARGTRRLLLVADPSRSVCPEHTFLSVYASFSTRPTRMPRMAGNIPALSWVVLEVAAGVEPALSGFADRRLAVQPRDQSLASASQGRGAQIWSRRRESNPRLELGRLGHKPLCHACVLRQIVKELRARASGSDGWCFGVRSGSLGPRTDREVREGGKSLYLPFRKNAMRTKKCSPALGRIADSIC